MNHQREILSNMSNDMLMLKTRGRVNLKKLSRYMWDRSIEEKKNLKI